MHVGSWTRGRRMSKGPGDESGSRPPQHVLSRRSCLTSDGPIRSRGPPKLQLTQSGDCEVRVLRTVRLCCCCCCCLISAARSDVSSGFFCYGSWGDFSKLDVESTSPLFLSTLLLLLFSVEIIQLELSSYHHI